MRADLSRRKLLFKAKSQPANSSICYGGDAQYNTEVDERMHREDVKITDLVGEHLQTKEKTRMGDGW
jgi:hypothetical protein